MTLSRFGFVSVLATCVSLMSFSVMAGGPELKPKVAGATKLIYSSDFSEKALSKKYQAPKGDWRIEDGKLVGSELKADKHAAVLNLAIPNEDLIIEFDVTLNDGKMFALSFNKERGHLWRLKADANGFSLIKDKDKKNPKSKPQVMSTASPGMKKGKTYRLQVEMSKDRLVARSKDGAFVLEASHAEFAQPKPNIRFVLSGPSVAIDNLKVWELK